MTQPMVQAFDPELVLDEMARIPVQPGIGLTVLRTLDDPNTSAASIGQLIEQDPGLATRLISVANSSYYGLATPAANAWRAITVIGLATVRSLVTAAALDLGTVEGISVPDGFWSHATATAAAAGILAPRADVNAGDAFSLGLLHDIGHALVFRRLPDLHAAIAARVDEERALVDIEREALGFDHGELSARALATLGFSTETLDAIRTHHDPGPATSMATVLHAADAVAATVTGEGVPEERRDLDEALRPLDVRDHEQPALLQRICDIIDEMSHVFTTR